MSNFILYLFLGIEFYFRPLFRYHKPHEIRIVLWWTIKSEENRTRNTHSYIIAIYLTIYIQRNAFQYSSIFFSLSLSLRTVGPTRWAEILTQGCKVYVNRCILILKRFSLSLSLNRQSQHALRQNTTRQNILRDDCKVFLSGRFPTSLFRDSPRTKKTNLRNPAF